VTDERLAELRAALHELTGHWGASAATISAAELLTGSSNAPAGAPAKPSKTRISKTPAAVQVVQVHERTAVHVPALPKRPPAELLPGIGGMVGRALARDAVTKGLLVGVTDREAGDLGEALGRVSFELLQADAATARRKP